RLAGEQEDTNDLQAIADLLIEWVQQPSWDASENFLKDHQSELMSPVGLQVMQMLIDGNNQNPTLVQHLEILKQAIQNGIEQAYAPMKKPLIEKLGEIEAVIQQESESQKLAMLVSVWLMQAAPLATTNPEDSLMETFMKCVESLETVILPKAQQIGEEKLIEACRALMGSVCNHLLVLYDNRKNYPQALVYISKAIEHQPTQAMFYRNRAGIYLDIKDYPNALVDIEKAQGLQPDAERLKELWENYHKGIGGEDETN
ncbi:MAG: hypothetical protein KJ043_21400, partial [Anaerolineae bacterium]|nr:hypothetical protein [Anaerolineae bacterium]